MLTFEDINIENWSRFEKEVIRTEQIYPEALRTPAYEFNNILSGPNIFKCAFVDSKYSGNAIGYPLETSEDLESHGVDVSRLGEKIIYLQNLAILPNYQGKGIGYKLLKEFIRSAKEKGFETLIGHFRPNGSLALIKKFGAKEVKQCHNWEGSTECFVMCELDLLRD
jgi:ribosomal protein S18 acetylase RimI-like enzyme